MSDSLGEKLRLAREERDISISEVAEQTRISALYLQAIENDDYRTLPGGIFNKGFVKSFAKYVGVDEHEALEEYAQIIAREEAANPASDPLNYRPEVLTDDSRQGSMLPTIIFAVIILGLMAWGILALVKYVQSLESGASGKDSLASSNVKTDETPAGNSNTKANQAEPMPATDSIKIKIKTSADELAVVAIADGRRETLSLTGNAKERTIEANEKVVLSYYKGLADSVSLELNGKKIETPMPPEGYRKQGLEFEINMENIKRILQTGKIEFGTPTVTGGEDSKAPVANTAASPALPANTQSGNAR
ncbi:MAG: helix-turn-helix domain-containing protein [Acidobacteriota bacterium]|nr:helix-turn-helix domain-containing protein [Acidobacteriota bacterium]MDH3530136.1 helix-turn-helix domain-containing protein [Acidobacteriota bacterium]